MRRARLRKLGGCVDLEPPVSMSNPTWLTIMKVLSLPR
jgi:hypothetical protein